MKKLVVVSASALAGFVFAVTLLGFALLRLEPARAGAPTGQGGTGDTNGDGVVDISDAIFTLLYLFKGGPEPVACADAQALEFCRNELATTRAELLVSQARLAQCEAAQFPRIPATGQTECYRFEDISWISVPCDDTTCSGQDGRYQLGCAVDDRFVDNRDGTITDNCTALMWTQKPADVNGDGQWSNDDRLIWCDALNFCENLNFAGHEDWRLPNIRELESIVDYGRIAPAVDPLFSIESDFHMSSTSFESRFVWSVNLSGGGMQPWGKFVDRPILAVRTAK